MKLVRRFQDIRRRAESGDSFAQTLVGIFMECGFATMPDERGARLWYERAAAAGFPQGQYEYAMFLLDQEDVDDALGWLKKSAESGYAAAQLLLGHIYVEGRLVPKNFVLALELIETAAGQDHIPALSYLSRAYEEGVIVEANPGRAVEFLRKAAELGDAGAQYLWGMKLIEEKDKGKQEEGINWILRSAENDNTAANIFLGELYGLGHHGVRTNKGLSKYFLGRAKRRRERHFEVGLDEE